MLKYVLSTALSLTTIGGLLFLPKPPMEDTFNQEQLLCLTKNVYFESRGESIEGQKWVFDVTLNRINDRRWPNNACDVVYQEHQFEWTASESIDDHYQEFQVFGKIENNVKMWLLIDQSNTDANHFTTLETNTIWMDKMIHIKSIGNHKFFKG